MTILVLGINHKTASVALREKVAFSDEKRAFALRHIRQIELAESAVILSTCNRTEVYLHNKTVPLQETQHWIRQAIQWFAEIHQLDLAERQRCLYTYENLPAVNHLMEVACGLDSLILGEPQILGQVKQAYQMSEQHYQQEQQAISGELSRLFQKTFSTAKRVRTETNIGESAVSVAYAACSLARQIFESLSELTILLVGAGETIELVCRHLLRHGVKNMVISNRTLARAEALVEKLDTTAMSRNMVEKAQIMRRYRPMLLVDIAVPRDIEESAAELDSVYHYTVDDLQNIIQHNLSQREQASAQAKEIIQAECADFFAWLKVHQFSNVIRRYREEAELTRQDLLEKAIASLQQGEEAEQVLQELSYKLMNKLIHSPTKAMQTMVKNGNAVGLQTFSKALGMDDE